MWAFIASYNSFDSLNFKAEVWLLTIVQKLVSNNPMAIINLQTFVIRGAQTVPHWLRKDSQSHDNVIYSDKPGIIDMITYIPLF